MLSPQEVLMIVNGYIGVSSGYLGDFSYKSHEEFYSYYCDLDIYPSAYEGTTRQRFITILKESDDITQAKILRGVLEKYPLEYFKEEERERKKTIIQQIQAVISRLETSRGIAAENLVITNATVERAIKDTKILIQQSGAPSSVDRIHTTLHGYLRQVCKKSNIATGEDDSLTQLFSKLKANHPALQNLGTRQNEVEKIINAFSNVLDKLNPIRNKASLSHPNEQLLEEDEAMFVVNAAQTVLNYLNCKFK